ncbi:alpha/beta fold hydrolase [Streptomyces sp. MZ04]|uniref:thioesterase II family protein n=1 Tax=Streptomyces sp. MZ04 TaxID=2559236 RepID=UPI00107E6AF9|nr:alpha/beta fold hydrolase [Streptomyces sp. MZ04]TGB14468.1 thioesterase [Streptomyces sp. MZ04]
MTRDDRWIRPIRPAPQAPAVLVCLAHAGGSAAFFHQFAGMPADVAEMLAVQYPGRQERRTEASITSLTELADRVTEALMPYTTRPMVLFGHSMGGLVGHEVAARLTTAGRRPSALVVSGARAPSRHRDESVHRRSEAGIVDELRRLGGVDPAFLDDPELLQMIMPPLRGDYRAIESYRPVPGTPSPVPITVLTGDQDPMVTAEDAAAWSRHTSGGFALHTFSGGHFYLTEHIPEILAILCDVVTGAAKAAPDSPRNLDARLEPVPGRGGRND